MTAIVRAVQFILFLPTLVWMIIVDSLQAHPQLLTARERRTLGLERYPYDGVIVLLGLSQLFFCALAGFFAGTGAPSIQKMFFSTGGETMTFDPFTQTVAALIALILTGVLPAAVAYVLNYLLPSLNGWLKNILQSGLVLVFTALITALAQQIPQSWLDKSVFDALVALIAIALGWAGSIFGTYHGKAAFVAGKRVELDVAAIRQVAKLTSVLMLAVLALWLFGSAPVSADAPLPDLQPWMIAAAGQGIGGSTPAQVQTAFKNFQNARAARFNWDTAEKWQSNYGQTVTDFLHQHGCISCGIVDGQLTYPLKIALPVGISDYLDILPSAFAAALAR